MELQPIAQAIFVSCATLPPSRREDVLLTFASVLSRADCNKTFPLTRTLQFLAAPVFKTIAKNQAFGVVFPWHVNCK